MKPRLEVTAGVPPEFLGTYLRWAEQQWLAYEGMGHKFKYIDRILIEIFNPGNSPGYIRFVYLAPGQFTLNNKNLIPKLDDKGQPITGSDGKPVMVRKYPNISTIGYNAGWEFNGNDLDLIMYGNTDWKGFDETVLAWCGVSSRHGEVNPLTQIANYMIFDEEVGTEHPVNYYTPFSSDIYASGAVLFTVPNGGALVFKDGVQQFNPPTQDDRGNVVLHPVVTQAGSVAPKVLGCAYLTYGDKQTALIAVIGTNYRDLINPDSTSDSVQKGGFFNELCIQTSAGWARIGYERGSRPVANWFFNQSGTEAQCVTYGKVRKVAIAAEKQDDGSYKFTASFTNKPACTGSTTESVTVSDTPYGEGKTEPGLWDMADPASYTTKHMDKVAGSATDVTIKVTETQTCIQAVDYIEDREVVATAVSMFAEESTNKRDIYSVRGWLDNIPYDAPAAMVVGFTDSVAGVGSCPTLDGGCAPFTWSITGPATLLANSSCIETVGCTGSGISQVVWTVTDSAGNTASSPAVKLSTPTSQWVLIESGTYAKPAGKRWASAYAPSTPPTFSYTQESGVNKTVYTGFYAIEAGCDGIPLTDCGNPGEAGSSVFPWVDGGAGAAPSISGATPRTVSCYFDGAPRCLVGTTPYASTFARYEWRCP